MQEELYTSGFKLKDILKIDKRKDSYLEIQIGNIINDLYETISKSRRKVIIQNYNYPEYYDIIDFGSEKSTKKFLEEETKLLENKTLLKKFLALYDLNMRYKNDYTTIVTHLEEVISCLILWELHDFEEYDKIKNEYLDEKNIRILRTLLIKIKDKYK